MMRRPSPESRTLFAEKVVKALSHGRLRTMRPELREAAREAAGRTRGHVHSRPRVPAPTIIGMHQGSASHVAKGAP